MAKALSFLLLLQGFIYTCILMTHIMYISGFFLYSLLLVRNTQLLRNYSLQQKLTIRFIIRKLVTAFQNLNGLPPFNKLSVKLQLSFSIFLKASQIVKGDTNICTSQHLIYNNCYCIQIFSIPVFNRISSFEFLHGCPC